MSSTSNCFSKIRLLHFDTICMGLGMEAKVTFLAEAEMTGELGNSAELWEYTPEKHTVWRLRFEDGFYKKV